MLLAVAALLLHSAAVPQTVVSSIPAAQVQTDTATSDKTLASVPVELSAANEIASPEANSPSAAPVSTEGNVPEFNTSDFALTAADLNSTYNPVSVTVLAVPLDPPSPADPAFLAVSSGPTERDRAAEYRRKSYWLSLAVVQQFAATFDAFSTRQAISRGGHELNPLLKPFAGNDSLYLAIQASPVALDYLSHRMMTSDHEWMRRTWWIPQSAGTVLSFASGIHNLGVVAP
jgi:hypothetical protein